MDLILNNTMYIPNNIIFNINMNNYKNIIWILNKNFKLEYLLNINIIYSDNIYKYYRLKTCNSIFFKYILRKNFHFTLCLKVINNIIIPENTKTEIMIKYILNINNSYLFSLYICNFNKIECLFSDDKNMFYKTLNKIINKKMIKKQKKIEILYIDLNN